MKAKTLSVLAAIPWLSLALGTAPTFAQSPAAASQHLSQRSPVIPSKSYALGSPQPVVSTNLPAAIAKKLPMTPANLQQTIDTVNRYIQQNAQGLAHVPVTQLRQAGLSQQEPFSLFSKPEGTKP